VLRAKLRLWFCCSLSCAGITARFPAKDYRMSGRRTAVKGFLCRMAGIYAG
jgi:hypothetical protein